MLSVGGAGHLTALSRISAAEWLKRLGQIAEDAGAVAEPEAALSVITGAVRDALGDPAAAEKSGALKAGERDYRVSGIFLIAPDRRHNVLVANQGFPREQRRLSIPIAWNNPGEVVAKERFVLLENTDDYGEFRQFLKTSRMGSSIYMPIFASGRMIGQLVAAAQARWTYSAEDVAPLTALAGLAAINWDRTNGGAWWEATYPAPDAWFAEEHAI